MASYESDWPEYVPVAECRRQAAKQVQKLKKQGRAVAPVVIEGLTIASTVWGKAWCDNLERYRDYETRLPRGRSYVRNGAVIDLQIAPREVEALVQGSSLYRVAVAVTPVPATQWRAVCADCAGQIDSLVELLQGRLSKGVMERICRPGGGLFPKPAEIRFSCSCEDHASMCKHVAAVLYGVGARLDRSPELLFRMRGVDQRDLLAELDDAVAGASPGAAPGSNRILAADDVSALFGLEMAGAGKASPPRVPVRATPPPAAAAPVPVTAKRVRPAATPVTTPKAPAANVKSLAAQLAQSSGLDRKQSEALVGDVVTLIAEHLAAGTNVSLAGLGTLAVLAGEVRMGRNPATGAAIRIAAPNEVVFRPAKTLKDKV